MANAIVGSAKLLFLASLLGVPIGFFGGVYLSEFSGSKVAFVVRYAADLLNGVPSIVIGIFAYAMVVHPMHHFSALAGGIALGIMMIPIALRTTEEFLRAVPVSLREGLGVIPWSPLRGGWLSGKFKRGMSAPPEGSRIELAEKKDWGEKWSAYNNEQTWRTLDGLHEVSALVDRSPAQVAINWLLQKLGVTAPIVGARRIQQLESNIGATGWALSPDLVSKLDAASEISLPYPYDFILKLGQR